MTAEIAVNSAATSTPPKNDAEHTVFKMLLQGLSREQLLAWIGSDKNTVGLRAEDLDRLTDAARARMAELSHFQHQTELGKSLARLDDLYAKSYAIQDYKACHAIERERAKLLTANRPSSEPQPETPVAPDAAWLPLAAGASQLGFRAPRALQLWCVGKDPAHQPPIPHRKKGRAFLIQLEPVRAHLLRHASRLPPGFPRQALKAAPAQTSAPDADPEVDALDSIRSTRDLLQRILLNPAIVESASPQMLTALASVDNALLRREQAEEKGRGLVPKEDVRRMLQAIGQVYVDKITEVLAPVAAKSCIRMVLEHHNIDLKALNSDTLRFFEAEFRAAGQTTVEAIQREVDEQCAGLARLDLEPKPEKEQP